MGDTPDGGDRRVCGGPGHLVKLQAPDLSLVLDDHFLLRRSMITTCGICSVINVRCSLSRLYIDREQKVGQWYKYMDDRLCALCDTNHLMHSFAQCLFYEKNKTEERSAR